MGNPNLKPENAWQYEANIQYTHKTLKVQSGYFYRDITNFIDWVRDSSSVPYSPLNIGRNLIQGINARVSQNFVINKNHRLGYFVNYNYLLPNYQSSGTAQSKYVLETLRNQLIVGMNYGYKGFTFQVNGRFIERLKNTPYVLLDARVNYEIKGFTAYVDVTNIVNAVYKEAGAVPMPPRWLSVGLKYNWTQQ